MYETLYILKLTPRNILNMLVMNSTIKQLTLFK